MLCALRFTAAHTCVWWCHLVVGAYPSDSDMCPSKALAVSAITQGRKIELFDDKCSSITLGMSAATIASLDLA